MSIQEAIYTRTSEDATIASYCTDVTEQINDKEIEGTEYPHINFKCVSSPRRWRKPMRWERWQFVVTHTDYRICQAIRDRISLIWNQGSGLIDSFLIYNANVIDSGGSPIFESEVSAYQASCDMRLSYMEV